MALLTALWVVVAAWIFFPHGISGLVNYMGKKKVLAEMNATGSACREIHLDRWGRSQRTFPMNRVPLERNLFLTWVAALPPDGSVSGRFSKCWDPHHSIRFTMADGAVAELEICFICNEFETEVAGRRKIPEDWREPFRELFRMHGITDKAPTEEEIARHWEKIDQEP